MTAHKCQGETLDEVVIDFGPDLENKIKNYICPGSFYVALTRVREGCKVFLKSFDKSFIQVNKKIEEKVDAMIKYRSYVFKKVYLDEKIFTLDDSEIKVGYLNINGLMDGNHAQYFNADMNLKSLDMIVLAETKLEFKTSDITVTNALDNWKIIGRYDSQDEKKHMGMLLLFSKKSNLHVQIRSVTQQTVKRDSNYQIESLIVKMENSLTFGFIYCRSTPSNSEIIQIKKNFKECKVIMGDLNLSHRLPSDQKKVVSLCQENKVNALKEITRSISCNQLDYILVDKLLISVCFATSFNNFISDHKSITARIGLNENQLTNELKQKLTFDRESHLKSKSSTRDEEDSCSDHSFGSKTSQENNTFDKLRINTSEDSIDDNQISPKGSNTRPLNPFRRKFRNQDSTTCWLNSCLQLLLTLMDYSDSSDSFTSELGYELMQLKQNLLTDILDPTAVKYIIVTSEDTRIATRLSQLANELTDPRELEKRSKAIENARIDLSSGQQCVRDFFLCLQANFLNWPDIWLSLVFDITHSSTCSSCNRVQSSETRQMFLELPVPPANSSLSDHIDEYFNNSYMVGVFCDVCQNLVQVEKSSRMTKIRDTEFLTVILTRAQETLDGFKLVENEVISTNNISIRYT